MSPHTPGPWTTAVTKVDEDTGNDVMAVLALESKTRIGIIGLEIYGEEDEANVHLMAAAPTMLNIIERLTLGIGRNSAEYLRDRQLSLAWQDAMSLLGSLKNLKVIA